MANLDDPGRRYPAIKPALWPLSLARGLSASQADALSAEADRLAQASQYGWGHSIDFGSFRKEGLLREAYLDIAGLLDEWGWWPKRLDTLQIADVGCFTGGLSLLMEHRGAATVHAVDEIPEHLAQCQFLVRAFGASRVRCVLSSAYDLRRHVEPHSLDIVLLAGVLYHMSDMLVGLYAMRELLKPGGLVLIQSNGIDDFDHSYANFGRFVAGRWWQPTGLCIQDMCAFMGFVDCEARFHSPTNCLARGVATAADIPFRRGLNWPFDDLKDARPRSLDIG